MDKVINFGLPHIGEQVFQSLESDTLIQCLKVSEAWKVYAETVLLQRWKGKLGEACKDGKTEIVQILLNNLHEDNTELENPDGSGNTPFMLACTNGHKDVIKLLIEHCSSTNIDLLIRNRYKMTVFSWACCLGLTDVVRLLLDHSRSRQMIDINASDNDGDTALHEACFWDAKILSNYS